MKTNKICALVLCMALVILTLFTANITAFGEEGYTAKAVCLMDEKSGEIAFEKNADKRLPVASMTKIMTLAVVFDQISQGNLGLEDIVVPSQNAQNMGGSQVFLEAGGSYKVKDLITSISIASANDSCVALAEHIAGSQEGFCDMMNEKAEKLGMTNTHFSNCTGLPSPDGYSSARDMCVAMRELITNPEYFEHASVWMTDFAHPNGRITAISNTNKLLRRNIGVDGGKTGYTSEAKHCITATAKRGNNRFIACVIGGESSKARFDECERLLSYGFANFESRAILTKAEVIAERCPVKKGKSDSIAVTPESGYYSFAKKREEVKEEIKCFFDEVKAPVKVGDRVGEAVVYKEGAIVAKIPLLAAEKVEKKGFFGGF